MKTPAPLPPFTALEEALAGPGGNALREKLLGRIKAIRDELQRQVSGMNSRAEFARLSSLVPAAGAAQEILQAWPAGPQGGGGVH